MNKLVPIQDKLTAMNIELSLLNDFGTNLSDGYRAAEYRMGRVDPYVDLVDKIVLDFTGVRNANSSFVNALVAGTIEQYGKSVVSKLVFKGCNPLIKVLVEAAIYLGMQKPLRPMFASGH